MKNKINLPSAWAWFTAAFFAVCWILLVSYMRLSEWILVPVYSVYIIINVIIFWPYVLGQAGTFFLMTGRHDKAFKYYGLAVKKNTRNVFALYQYAVEILKEGRAEEALKYLIRAGKINAKVIMEKNILLATGSCYWVLGDIDKGIEVLEGLKDGYEYVNAHVLTTLGYFYYLKEDNEKALLYTNRALEDEPEYAAAWDNLGQIYFRSGDMPKAKESFLKALSYKETMVDSLFFMGLISERENDEKSASQYFDKAADCSISALNTVTRKQIEEKRQRYGRGTGGTDGGQDEI